MLKRSLFSQFLLSNLLLCLAASCACTDQLKPEAKNKDKDKDYKDVALLTTLEENRKNTVQKAIAKIKSFKGDQIKGIVTFTRVPEGIKIVADVKGLTPGKHGFHVHEFGDCSEEGAAVGSHFNPDNSKHGGPDSTERHVGDLGNLVADENGYAHYEIIDKIISFEGENSIIGHSIIVHADPDDYTTQPAGASGKKIACGIIEADASSR